MEKRMEKGSKTRSFKWSNAHVLSHVQLVDPELLFKDSNGTTPLTPVSFIV